MKVFTSQSPRFNIYLDEESGHWYVRSTSRSISRTLETSIAQDLGKVTRPQLLRNWLKARYDFQEHTNI